MWKIQNYFSLTFKPDLTSLKYASKFRSIEISLLAQIRKKLTHVYFISIIPENRLHNKFTFLNQEDFKI